jgi:hypothetical protein
MTAKTELMQAHETMAAVLDAKFSGVPEWKAFRAIDRALLALETEHAAAKTEPAPAPKRARVRQGVLPSYNSLTDQALKQVGKPVPTGPLVNFISGYRDLGNDLEKAKINITSGLSKSRLFRSVPWEGGRAWWYADKPVPKKETAKETAGA